MSSEFLSNFFGRPVKKTNVVKKKRVSSTVKKNVTKPVYVFDGIQKSKTDGKKYDAVFVRSSNGTKKIVSFGKSGEKDFTQHGDKEMRDFYDFKYKKKQDWGNLMSPQALNKWICWDKPTLEKGISSYKKMFDAKKQ